MRIRPIVPLAFRRLPAVRAARQVYLNQLDGVRHRQRHAEPRARPGVLVEIDPPVVRVDDLPHDRQAQAGSLRLGREKRVEDPVAQLRRHARAVVGDVDDDRRRRRLASPANAGSCSSASVDRRDRDVAACRRAPRTRWSADW